MTDIDPTRVAALTAMGVHLVRHEDAPVTAPRNHGYDKQPCTRCGYPTRPPLNYTGDSLLCRRCAGRD